MANERRSDGTPRTRAERIGRLRRRLEEASFRTDRALISVLKGILDLLADEP